MTDHTATTASLRTMMPMLRGILATQAGRAPKSAPTIDLYPADLSLEDLPATFDDNSEWVPDTDSHYSPRTEKFICELVSVEIGGKRLNRYDIVEMVGETDVRALEESRAVELEA